MLKQQRVNLIRAYKKNDMKYSELENILDTAQEKFNGLFQYHEFTRPLSEEHLKELPYLQNLPPQYPDYAFNFTGQHVTERATGKCIPLKKWCETNKLETTDKILSESKTSTILIISSSPEFLAGMSVTALGRQLDDSCHYPGSTSTDYKSGAISCALDPCTIGFFKWSNGGISGRQLVYINNDFTGFITTRNYGNFTGADSTFLRKELYKIMQVEKFRKPYGNSCIDIIKHGYSGYLDSTYFTAYRKPGNSGSITIHLAKPLCPECGDSHANGGLYCDNCDIETIKCASCNCSLHDDDTYSTDYDGPYCQSCFSDNYSYCSNCSDTFNKEYVHDCDGEYLCERCAKKQGFYPCTNCGEYINIDDSYTYNDNFVCERCLPSGAIRCDDCGEYFDLCDIETDVDATRDYETHFCNSCSSLTECNECGEHTSNGEFCRDCEEMLENTPYICPVCNVRLEIPSCCSDTCASKALFKTGPFFTSAPYMINARKGLRDDFIRVQSFRQFHKDGYLFHVTNQVDNKNMFTITEHDTGLTASQWFTGTIEATLIAFNNWDIDKTVTALQYHERLRGAN